MRNNQRTAFPTVTSEGALLPVDVLQRIAQFDASLGGITAEDYHHDGEKLNEVINDAWLHVLRAWNTFQTLRGRLPEGDTGTTLTRERWLLPLFNELGYGRLFSMKALEADGKSYPISHGWQHMPIHLVSYRTDLDQLSRSGAGEYRYSPYSLTQELLNRSGEHLWGVVSNGLRLRLLRKNVSLTRQAYVEFDLGWRSGRAWPTNRAFAPSISCAMAWSRRSMLWARASWPNPRMPPCARSCRAET